MKTNSVTPEDLAYLDAEKLTASFHARTLSPVEVAKAALERIAKWNPSVNAYCYLNPEITLKQARASEARWMKGEPLSALDGILYGIKDLLLVRGAPTGYGSRAGHSTEASADDAPSAARLRESGAVFIGKTTTSEFGWKGTADSPLTGNTLNPWNTNLTSGGSSGGAACAAAAGMGSFQIGTDGGGSVRIPASFCGVVGMKATFGRVSAWPAGPMLTLSNVGPIARTVEELASVLHVVMRPDPRDWNAVPAPRDVRSSAQTLQGLRFGFHLGGDECDPEVRSVILHAVDQMSNAGANIIETKLPLTEAKELITTHWEAGAAWLASRIPEERRDLLDAGLQAAASRGRALSLPEYYTAMTSRQKFGEAMLQHVGRFDVVLTPAVPILPFAAGREAPANAKSQDWLDWNPYTYPFNLTRQPAISLPGGRTPDGIPVGLQLVAGLYQDEWLVSVAKLVETALALEPRRPGPPVG